MKYKLIKGSYSDFKSINGLKKKKNVKLLVCKIKDLFETVTGNTPSLNNDIFWSSSKGVKWISTPDFKYQKNGYISSNSRFLTEDGVKKSRLCPKDTLLVSCIATIGEVGLIKEPSCFNQQINAILPNSKFNSKYLRYYFLANKQDFINYAPLSVVKIINKKMFNDFEICIHKDLKEQSSIVYILEKQESIISNIEKLISKTEKIFDYFELNLLSGKISLDDNKSNSWEKIKIKDSMNILYGKRITKKESSGLIPVYGGGNASFYTDSYSYENKWVIGRFALSKKCVRFISDKFWLLDSGFTFTSINNDEDFLGFKINSMQDYIYNVLARGAAQKNLDMKEFENLEIVIPPYDEQQKISKFLRKIVNLLNYQNQLLQKEKEKFEWLSEKLLSGEYLVVEE